MSFVLHPQNLAVFRKILLGEDVTEYDWRWVWAFGVLLISTGYMEEGNLLTEKGREAEYLMKNDGEWQRAQEIAQAEGLQNTSIYMGNGDPLERMVEILKQIKTERWTKEKEDKHD